MDHSFMFFWNYLLHFFLFIKITCINFSKNMKSFSEYKGEREGVNDPITLVESTLGNILTYFSLDYSIFEEKSEVRMYMYM